MSPPIIALNKSDIDMVDIDPTDVLEAVEAAYAGYATGESANPGKLVVAHEAQGSIAYAMLGRDGGTQTVGFKTSYKFDPHEDRSLKRYHTTLALYDDTTGEPVALMDCGRIGALRTPAVTALFIRECARPGATRVLCIGTGTQGRQALPFALTANPGLTDLSLYGTHADGIAATVAEFSRNFPGRTLRVVDDLEAEARAADVIIAAAGAASPVRIPAEWVKEGAVSVLVGHGLAPSALAEADYVVATNAEQMRTTGQDMADADGVLRRCDAELPDVLAGRRPARGGVADRVFAYSSGMVITDIAVGTVIAAKARAQRLGTYVNLWA